VIHRKNGEFDDSLTNHSKALEILKNTIGLNNPHAAQVYIELYRLYSETKHLKKALENIEKGVKTRISVLGPTHPKTIDSLEMYADLLDELNRPELSRKIRDRVKDIRSTYID